MFSEIYKVKLGVLRGVSGKITYYTVGWEPPPRLRRYSPYDEQGERLITFFDGVFLERGA